MSPCAIGCELKPCQPLPTGPPLLPSSIFGAEFITRYVKVEDESTWPVMQTAPAE